MCHPDRKQCDGRSSFNGSLLLTLCPRRNLLVSHMILSFKNYFSFKQVSECKANHFLAPFNYTGVNLKTHSFISFLKVFILAINSNLVLCLKSNVDLIQSNLRSVEKCWFQEMLAKAHVSASNGVFPCQTCLLNTLVTFAALVEEVYSAQRERDKAVMARLRLANEERDEAFLRVQRLEESLKE